MVVVRMEKAKMRIRISFRVHGEEEALGVLENRS